MVLAAKVVQERKRRIFAQEIPTSDSGQWRCATRRYCPLAPSAITPSLPLVEELRDGPANPDSLPEIPAPAAPQRNSTLLQLRRGIPSVADGHRGSGNGLRGSTGGGREGKASTHPDRDS